MAVIMGIDTKEVVAKEVVTELQAYCRNGGQEFSDYAKLAGQKYADLVRSANRRLRQCDDLLGKGLNSEAIHLAELHPPILETISLLSFPERGLWDNLVNKHRYDPAEPLLIESAKALQKSYSYQTKNLNLLLARHRKMALSQAPLPERLKVLYDLAVTDKTNPIWAEDIYRLETACQQELFDGIHQAHKEGDDDKTLKLLRDLEKHWENPPSFDFLQPLMGIYLELVFAQLEQSAKERNLSKVRAELAEYDALAAKLTHDDWERKRNVDQIRNWLRKEDKDNQDELEYQTAVAKFLDELEKGSSIQALESAWHEVEEFEGRANTSLRKSYESRVKEIESRGRIREILIVVGTLVVGAIFLAIILLVFVKSR
jgi:hypothetical protein